MENRVLNLTELHIDSAGTLQAEYDDPTEWSRPSVTLLLENLDVHSGGQINAAWLNVIASHITVEAAGLINATGSAPVMPNDKGAGIDSLVSGWYL